MQHAEVLWAEAKGALENMREGSLVCQCQLPLVEFNRPALRLPASQALVPLVSGNNERYQDLQQPRRCRRHGHRGEEPRHKLSRVSDVTSRAKPTRHGYQAMEAASI